MNAGGSRSRGGAGTVKGKKSTLASTSTSPAASTSRVWIALLLFVSTTMILVGMWLLLDVRTQRHDQAHFPHDLFRNNELLPKTEPNSPPLEAQQARLVPRPTGGAMEAAPDQENTARGRDRMPQRSTIPAKHVHIFMDWTLHSDVFGYFNYKSLESVLAAFSCLDSAHRIREQARLGMPIVPASVRVLLPGPAGADYYKYGSLLSKTYFQKYQRNGFDVKVVIQHKTIMELEG
jgi:hypothetical protein